MIGRQTPDMKRLLTLFKYATLACLLCLLYGFLIEPKLLKTRHVTIESPNWKGPDLRIGVMTDLHIGGMHVDAKRMASIVTRMNEEAPDVILLTGDYIDGHIAREAHDEAFNKEIDGGLSALGGLRAQQGIYAGIGNHDAWYDKAFVMERLKVKGITILDNSTASVAGACLVGLQDSWTGKPSGDVFSQCPKNAEIIAMSHSPDALKHVPEDIALFVAGHTHGGQINIPFIGRRVTSTKIGPRYAYGVIYDGGRATFVSAGIGTSMLPARFRAPPEIVILSLKGND